MANQNQNFLQILIQIPQRIIRYIWEAVNRIFSPTESDNDYPNTGVQPFEGEPNQDKRHNL